MNRISKMKSLYMDGGCIKKNPSSIGGTWAYCLVNYDGKLLYEDYGVIRAGYNNYKDVVTNNQMELLAVIRGLQTLQRDMTIHIYSDSEITLGRLFKGYSMENIPEWMVEELKAEIKRLHMFKDFKYTLLSGHPTKIQLESGVGKHDHPVSIWNKRADELCNKAAQEHLQSLIKL